MTPDLLVQERPEPLPCESAARILFVDDEPHLLSGLRRMLRGARPHWQLSFAAGGAEALDLLARQPVDVVVSDMRMPGMDGAQLLTAVRRLHPGTSRVILSGHADRASIIAAIGPTQQYLAKPCDEATLVQTLDRVLLARELVTDRRLRELLGDVESLPKPTGLHQSLLALAADPHCRIGDVADLIEQDVATSTEVLHLVNSSFFGLPHRVDSIARAVGLLGLETIQALAVAGALFRQAGRPVAGLDLRELSLRGLLVARTSAAAAAEAGWPASAVEDAFFSGLLHEVGLIALAAADPQGWSALRGLGPHDPGDPWAADEAQRQAFGCSATRASAYLLALWGFGEPLVDAIAGQPAAADDLAALPAAQLLTQARVEAGSPPVLC